MVANILNHKGNVELMEPESVGPQRYGPNARPIKPKTKDMESLF